MTASPIAVYAALDDDLGPGIQALEAAGFRVLLADSDSPHVLGQVAPDAVALLVGYGSVDQAVLAALPGLKVISLCSQGHDNVDLGACARAGVQVAHLPPVATEEVATHAWALTLSLVRQLAFFTQTTPDTWTASPPVTPRRLSELSIGIVGTGHIAAQYARLAAGHVASLTSWSRSGRTLPGATSISDVHQLAATSDVVSLHLPLTTDTLNLVDDAFLAAMRPGSWLVNVGRGGLIDSAALARALDRGHLAGAALDVLDQEPPGPDHPLLGRPNVLITPHVGWLSAESARAYVVEQANNVIDWLRTGTVSHPVTL